MRNLSAIPESFVDSARKLRCPRCGAPPGHLTEYWDGMTMQFEYRVADGRQQVDEYGHMSDGAPVRVVAVCHECDHEWTLRGIRCITQLHRPNAEPVESG